MRAPVVVAAALILASGCADSSEPAARPQSSPTALGGEAGPPSAPPAQPMNRVERAIADKLSGELSAQRLAIEYLDCPRFTEERSTTLTCHAFVEGVVAEVGVRLRGTRQSLEFDARLGTGLLATENLVNRLANEGYRRVECGDRAVYPTVVGNQIVYSVTDDGRQRYVVATVTTNSGEVEISDY